MRQFGHFVESGTKPSHTPLLTRILGDTFVSSMLDVSLQLGLYPPHLLIYPPFAPEVPKNFLASFLAYSFALAELAAANLVGGLVGMNI